tara:strand:+ start:389 stop:688 length:300 start_codon:yes stop_codon:yes gene_type:complete
MKDNKIIAEFMGLPKEVLKPDETINYYYKEYNSGTWYEAHELSYNVSWDWLMPVVVRCFDKQEDVSDDLSFKLNDALLETNIDTLYNVVIEFINTYKEI